MPTAGTLDRIARAAYAYGLTASDPDERAYAAGVEELARYLASGCGEADELLARMVPGLELPEA